MCHWDRKVYDCGCVKRTEFLQCAERKGSNVKCKPVKNGEPSRVDTLCIDHLVNPDAPQKFYRNDTGAWLRGPTQQQQQQENQGAGN